MGLAAPGGFAMLGRVQAKSPVWEVVDDDDLILGALKMAGASGDPRFGPLLIQLISRIFGLILIAISVQFMVERLRQVFPGWT